MVKADLTDEKIVRILGQNGRKTGEQIAKELNISAATVRRRIKKLVENDMLRFVAVVNPADFGFPLPAVIALDVIPEKLDSILEELSNHPDVKWMATTIGRYDIIAGVRFRSLDYLTEFVRNTLNHIEGIRDSETFICLKGPKDGPLLPLT
jgi:Lrp/AsnC family transcriptional regulator for asnA, asnC and gidA